MLSRGLSALVLALLILGPSLGDDAKRSAKDALQPFNDLIGSWRATGTPFGTRDQQRKNFWTETVACEWQFKGADAWLKFDFTGGKHFTTGDLRYLPASDEFRLTVQTPSKETQTYTGKLSQRVLTLERNARDENDRLVFTLLHSNRFLYRYETCPAGKTVYAKKWQVGATKEGVPFAAGDGKPECIVSGGLGTMAVTFQGKTYYVCCSGCRTEFQENPAKYVAEFEAKKARPK